MHRIGRSGLVVATVLIAIALVAGGAWVLFAARTLSPFHSRVDVQAGQTDVPLGSLSIAKLPMGNGSGGFAIVNGGKTPEWVQLTTRERLSSEQTPLVFSYEVELYDGSSLITTTTYHHAASSADGLPPSVLYVAVQSAPGFQVGTPWTLPNARESATNTIFLPAGYHASIEYAWTKSAVGQGTLSMTASGLSATHHTRVGKSDVGVGPLSKPVSES